MVKSRKDPSRKENLEKYKQSTKNKKQMSSAELPQSKPFRQVPTWDSNDTFEVQGSELEALYNFFNLFAPAFTSIQSIFARGVQGGKIKIGYEYEDGTPVPADEVADYTSKLNAYFKAKQAEMDAKKAEEEAPTTGKIVSFTGEPVSSETAVD